jgi:acyl-CoA thioester hydrolase
MAFLTEHGVTVPLMQEYHINPIIFREECFFKREIKFGDEVVISVRLDSVSEDHRKWSMVHEIWINSDTLAALITIDGSWMDTQLRKIAVPPAAFIKCFDSMPKTVGFRIITKA